MSKNTSKKTPIDGLYRFKFKKYNGYILSSIRHGLSTLQPIISLVIDHDEIPFDDKRENGIANVGLSLPREIEKLHLNFDPYDKNIYKIIDTVSASIEVKNESDIIKELYTTDIIFSDNKFHLMYGKKKLPIGFLMPGTSIRYIFRLKRDIKSHDGRIPNFQVFSFYDDTDIENTAQLAIRIFNTSINMSKYVQSVIDDCIEYVEAIVKRFKKHQKLGIIPSLKIIESDMLKSYILFDEGYYTFSILLSLLRYHIRKNDDGTTPLMNLTRNHPQGLQKFVKFDVNSEKKYSSVPLDVFNHHINILKDIKPKFKF